MSTQPSIPDHAGASPVAPGDVLAGKYRVTRVLGRGGMGVVVAAEHLQLGERVALKFLLPQAAEQPELRARFAQEARAAARIKSEHVARVSDVGNLENGSPYMVMEFLEGKDLSQVLDEKGKLPTAEAVDYVLQASEAIAEAHSIGIVHRDVKPSNLFLTRRRDGSPLVKVLDFGISKLVDPEGMESAHLTRTNTSVGSPLYMAPEQLRASKSVDQRADIWSLGVVLYELLSGRLPFTGETLTSLIASVLSDDPDPLDASTVAPELEATLRDCLKRAPSDRPRSVAELARRLAPHGSSRAGLSVERIVGLVGDGAFVSADADTSSHFARESAAEPPEGAGEQPWRSAPTVVSAQSGSRHEAPSAFGATQATPLPGADTGAELAGDPEWTPSQAAFAKPRRVVPLWIPIGGGVAVAAGLALAFGLAGSAGGTASSPSSPPSAATPTSGPTSSPSAAVEAPPPEPVVLPAAPTAAQASATSDATASAAASEAPRSPRPAPAAAKPTAAKPTTAKPTTAKPGVPKYGGVIDDRK